MTTCSQAKCDYTRERSAVRDQISILVGVAWMNARWACGYGLSLPTPGEHDFCVEQLRKVCEWYLPTLQAHAHEWRGAPLPQPYYPRKES